MIAVRAAASMEAMLRKTIDYAKDRNGFGQTVFDFQHNRFKLAELKPMPPCSASSPTIAWRRHMQGGLSVEMAATAKLLGTEMQNRLLDDCLQMHGGYGYMAEYEIAGLGGCARSGASWRQFRIMKDNHRAHAVERARPEGDDNEPVHAPHGLGGPLAAPFVKGAAAQERFPDKPIVLIVPFSAGGSTDVQMRALAEAASRISACPLVVEGRPGAAARSARRRRAGAAGWLSRRAR